MTHNPIYNSELQSARAPYDHTHKNSTHNIARGYFRTPHLRKILCTSQVLDSIAANAPACNFISITSLSDSLVDKEGKKVIATSVRSCPSYYLRNNIATAIFVLGLVVF